jgi:hypothetical protein
LLRGARLDQFVGWAEGATLALTPDERDFLEASLADRAVRRAEEEARQRRELETAQKLTQTEKQAARRLRWLAVGLAVFLLAAVGAAWFASNQRNIAQNNFDAAERIRLASQAQIVLDNGEGGDLPALLALRSLQHDYSPEADAALLTALKRGFTRQRYLGHTNEIGDARFSPTAAMSSPPARIIRPGCGTPRPARNCASSLVTPLNLIWLLSHRMAAMCSQMRLTRPSACGTPRPARNCVASAVTPPKCWASTFRLTAAMWSAGMAP